MGDTILRQSWEVRFRVRPSDRRKSAVNLTETQIASPRRAGDRGAVRPVGAIREASGPVTGRSGPNQPWIGGPGGHGGETGAA